ncbi:metallophosphoesterase [Primorskyibacter sp. S87]|uniref:metallophosphoesterase n=1 Tax=Primorskyibacter sp. S87 TaxID=3415126 RepID=UPI003C7B2734
MKHTVYAIADIHGQLAMLDAALDLVEKDGGADARIIFLGDYVDRGPDSCGVIQRLIEGQEHGRDWIFLKGNHDDLFWNFATQGAHDDPRIRSGLNWLHPRLGGLETLKSYGIDTEGEISTSDMAKQTEHRVPAPHLKFLEKLNLFHREPGLLFVHAGILPGRSLDQQTEDDLIWIRDPFLRHAGTHPWLVVHGHTALEHPRHFGNRIDLDGGAGYGRPLHPAVFEDGKCWLLGDQGRFSLPSEL